MAKLFTVVLLFAEKLSAVFFSSNPSRQAPKANSADWTCNLYAMSLSNPSRRSRS